MKVLIPVDASDNCQKAFDWYLTELRRPEDIVVLVHFVPVAGSEKDLQQKEAKLMELQESYETRLLQHKVDYRWLTGSGSSPGEYIIQAATEEDVNMIIMGPRGLGKLRKAFLGSVSDYVLNKSSVPVLLYKRS